MARDNPEEPLVVEPKARMHSAVKAIFDAAWGETGKPQHVRTGIPILRMLVQMIDDQRIRVELFPISSTAAAFTNNARDFLR